MGYEEGQYNVLSAIPNMHIPGVEPKDIHPYMPYQDGTKARCIVNDVKAIKRVPCTVVSHKISRDGGFVLFKVSYLDEEKTMVLHELPKRFRTPS